MTNDLSEKVAAEFKQREISVDKMSVTALGCVVLHVSVSFQKRQFHGVKLWCRLNKHEDYPKRRVVVGL